MKLFKIILILRCFKIITEIKNTSSEDTAKFILPRYPSLATIL